MAKKIVRIGDIATVLEQRIQERLKRIAPGDPRIREVLTRIGILLQAEARMNIRRKHIIDTGTLYNSIQYRIYQRGNTSSVEVGSYGVPYAAAHEFGFDGQVLVTPKRMRTSAFGRPTRPYLVPPHFRHHRVRARPYLRPALKDKRNQIVELIRNFIRGGGV